MADKGKESIFIRMKKVVICTLALLTGFPVFSQDKLFEQDRKAIMEIFEMTEDAWNSGDIDRFMEGYWKSDKLVFVGSAGPTYGWEATRERYHASYPDRATMGKLDFEVLDIKKIDTQTVLLIGKFHLSRTIGDLSGHYTLIWQKIDGKWVIVADHSSASSSATTLDENIIVKKKAEDEEKKL